MNPRAVIVLLLALTASVAGEESLTPSAVIDAVNARPSGQRQARDVSLTLTNSRGQTREQALTAYREDVEGRRQTVLLYRAPARIRGTALLLYDYHAQDTEDDQWLYLPSFRKVRRIAGANRGDYFLNTDLSYDDIKNEGRLVEEDYAFEVLGEDTISGSPVIRLQGVATAASREELGYSRVVWWVDPALWLSRRIEMWDSAGNRLKTLENYRIERIDDIWSVTALRVTNHKSGHVTDFVVDGLDYDADIPAQIFQPRALGRSR